MKINAFLTSALDEGESFSCSGHVILGQPQRRYGEGRSYCPPQELNPGHPITSFTEMT